jgi:hypothetical protein
VTHIYEGTFPSTLIDHIAILLARILLFLALLLAVPFFAGCRSSDPPAPHAATPSPATAGAITLTSDSLANGTVPREFTCDGADVSPPLKWAAGPPNTRSFVLTATDPDAPGGAFTHWVVFNLPANTSALEAGHVKQDRPSDGSRQGRNDFNAIGYGGPCPPHGSTHRYFFDLFALDSTLDLPAGATRPQVEDAMNTHVLARGKLMARYGR